MSVPDSAAGRTTAGSTYTLPRHLQSTGRSLAARSANTASIARHASTRTPARASRLRPRVANAMRVIVTYGAATRCAW